MWRRCEKIPNNIIECSLMNETEVHLWLRKMDLKRRTGLCNVLNVKVKTRITIKYCDLSIAENFARQHQCVWRGLPTYINLIRTYNHTVPSGIPTNVPCKLWDGLFDYQKRGVEIICSKTRILLADDMGLGKTRQGLCFLAHWNTSSLIVCPSYLRYHWKAQIEEWLGLEAQVIKTKKTLFTSNICIMSYDMLNGVTIPQFNCILADESHYIKNRKTKRTKAFLHIGKKAKQVLLMSGTPALNRPIELYTQMHVIQPQIIKHYTHYATRYCAAKKTAYGLDDRGASNSHELHYMLNKMFMIRRLKRNVLQDLPPKIRHTVLLEVESHQLLNIDSGKQRWKELNREIERCGGEEQRTLIFERKSLISDLFRQTCSAKIKSVCTWLQNALEYTDKIVFFAHHRQMLDAVEQTLQHINYIRIDGSTPTEKRQQRVEQFQTQPEIRIAILGLLSAGTGNTLTAASTVVFGELYWIPGIMIQAEDRCHRISQINNVDIHYLIGQDTLDSYVYDMLQRKCKIINKVVSQPDSLQSTKQPNITNYCN